MAKWIPSWRYVPIDYNLEAATLENVTQKCVMTNNLGGSRVRLRFNNLYQEAPITIEHAAVALCSRRTGITTPWYPVTLDGSERILVPGNTRPWSDELALTVTPEDDILTALYFGGRTVVRSLCTTSAAAGWQSIHLSGDYTRTEALGFTMKAQLAPMLANDPYPPNFAAGLCEISVLTEDPVQLIALFGDSITHMSYFMDSFIRLLYERFPGQYSVINAGISGNRILKPYPSLPGFPGEGHQFGIAGKDRFAADVYDGACPDLVFLMEGVNDCSHSLCFRESDVSTAADILAAARDVAEQAHSRGSRVILSTIAPFGAFSESWREAAEEIRCTCNDLIRQSDFADGVLDMDAVLRDAGDIHRMQASLHLGDGVHPNWRGGERMARALMKQLFG